MFTSFQQQTQTCPETLELSSAFSFTSFQEQTITCPETLELSSAFSFTSFKQKTQTCPEALEFSSAFFIYIISATNKHKLVQRLLKLSSAISFAMMQLSCSLNDLRSKPPQS